MKVKAGPRLGSGVKTSRDDPSGFVVAIASSLETLHSPNE